MSAGEDRLAHWARRKAEAARPAPAAAPEHEPADEAFLAALPKIEEIDAQTDIRGFLREGVPQALRGAALARAWMADPSIRDRIPDAIDYAEDYNAPHTISGWGPACPQQAELEVARALEPPPAETAPQPEIAQAEEPAPADLTPQIEAPPADEPAPAPPPQITKKRRRHGSALPLIG